MIDLLKIPQHSFFEKSGKKNKVKFKTVYVHFNLVSLILLWQNIDDFLNRFISFGSDYWHLKTVLRSLISFKVV